MVLIRLSPGLAEESSRVTTELESDHVHGWRTWRSEEAARLSSCVVEIEYIIVAIGVKEWLKVDPGQLILCMR